MPSLLLPGIPSFLSVSIMTLSCARQPVSESIHRSFCDDVTQPTVYFDPLVDHGFQPTRLYRTKNCTYQTTALVTLALRPQTFAVLPFLSGLGRVNALNILSSSTRSAEWWVAYRLNGWTYEYVRMIIGSCR
jgi:hypothetical protein